MKYPKAGQGNCLMVALSLTPSMLSCKVRRINRDDDNNKIKIKPNYKIICSIGPSSCFSLKFFLIYVSNRIRHLQKSFTNIGISGYFY